MILSSIPPVIIPYNIGRVKVIGKEKPPVLGEFQGVPAASNSKVVILPHG